MGYRLDGNAANYLDLPGQRIFPTATSPLPLALSAWLRPAAFSGTQSVFSNDSNANEPLVSLYFDGTLIRFYSRASVRVSTSTSAMVANRWNHVSALWDTEGFIHLIINGALRASTAAPVTYATIAGTSSSRIGRIDAALFPFLGDVAEYAFWYGETPSIAELESLWTESEAGIPATALSVPPIRYHSFDGTLADEMGGSAFSVAGTVAASEAIADSPPHPTIADGIEPALAIAQQPTATQSGYLIDPAPIVHVLDAEGALDTSFTGDVTASLLGSGGVLLGTLTVAAVAGVATFSNLRPCEAGTYQLRFAASGYANLDSATFAVTAGEGTTNVIVHQEAPMRPIRRNEPTAALRDIPITILADDGSPWDGDPDAGGGVKAMLSQNFGVETESPANIVKIAAGDFRVRPTDAYTDITEGSLIKARVPAAAGRRQAFGYAHIIPADTYVSADAARKALVDAVIIASDGGNGYDVVKQPESNQIQRNIPGVGVVTITAVFSPSVPGIVSAGGS